MERRQFVKAGASAILASVAATSLAEGASSANSRHRHQGSQGYGSEGGSKKYGALIDAAGTCVQAGELCLEHCLALLRNGDTTMARCSKAVSVMLPMCRAGMALAIQDSAHLKALAAICADTCRECQAACKEHAEHHEACNWCMETCETCAAECARVAA